MALILVVSPVPTHPHDAGNRVRIHNMLWALKNLGHTIHYIYSGSENGVDFKAMEADWDAFYFLGKNNTTKLKWLAIKLKKILRVNTEWLDQRIWNVNLPFVAKLFKPYLIDDWYNDRLDEHVKLLQKNHDYDVVIAEYVFFSKVLTLFDNRTLKVLDTHDVFANRHLIYTKQGKIPHYFYTTLEQELKGVNRADVVIAIQNEEFDYFKTICKKKVLLVGHICHSKKLKINTIGKTVKLLFVGSGSAPNIGALDFLCKEIGLQLKKKDISFVCKVVGNILPPILDNLNDFHFIGRVDDLESYYQEADIVINPVQIGTGLNIKSIEAISYGKPLITTLVGSQGLNEGLNRAFFVANEAEEFAIQVKSLMNDSTFYQQFSEGVYAFALEYNRKVLANLASF